MRLKILHKLLIVLILFAAVPLLVAGLRIINIAHTAKETNILEKHSDKAHEIAKTVDFYMGKWLDAMLLIANSQERKALEREEFENLLITLVESYEDIVLLQITFYDGSQNTAIKQTLLRDIQQKNQAYAQLIQSLQKPTQKALQTQEIQIDEVFKSPELETSFLTISVPIQRELIGVGALTGIIDLRVLQNAIQEHSITGHNEDHRRHLIAYIVDQNGRLLFHPDIKRVQKAENLHQISLINKVLTAQTGAIITESFTNLNGEKMLGAATFAKKVPWVVVVEEPFKEAYYSVQQMRTQLWSWMLVGLGLAVIFAFIFADAFNRPIAQLVEAARGVAAGNFNQQVHITNKDELGELAKVFNNMTAELRRYDEINVNKLISEQAKIQAIIRNIADGIIATDVQKRILFLNKQAEQWFGVDITTAQHRLLIESVKSDKLDQLISDTLYPEKSAEDEPKDHAVEISIVDAQTMENVALKALAAPVVDGKNQIIGVVTALRDITREKEIDRMKSEIVSVVSHELRTPLTSIQGFSQLMLDEDLPPEERQNYANIVISEADRLTHMINEFLDLSRLESGRMEITPIPFNLIDTLMNTVFVVSAQASEKNIAIYPDFYADDVYVYADMDTIGQVMMNLLSNAVKYSPPDREVTVAVTDEGDEVRVSVIDQGFGMKQSDADKVFDKFFRVKNEVTRDITGTGLGLPIVKEIIERHGKTIQVISELGKGSTFTFTLDKAKPEDFEVGMPDE
ncbi:MAG: sensor histidine kinase [Gemmatimonadetes bacterium]|nr:MAG: sensor histidine kinase [Gemmatimonadota bacterium]